MPVQDPSQAQKKMAYVQFIAEVSLMANCKPSDLKFALSMIADMASTETKESFEEQIFYAAE